jgi:hypothetical protein
VTRVGYLSVWERPASMPAGWVLVPLGWEFTRGGLADLLTCEAVMFPQGAELPGWLLPAALAAGVKLLELSPAATPHETLVTANLTKTGANRREVVFLGDDPGPRGDPDMPLYHLPRNSSGNRLLELLGWDDHDGLITPRINARYLHGGVKRAKPTPDVGRWLAPLLACKLSGTDRLVVVLGDFPAAAFGQGAEGLPYFMPKRGTVGSSAMLIAKVPHPSAKNSHLTMETRANMRAFGQVLLAWRRGPGPTPEGTECLLAHQDLAGLAVDRLGEFTDVGLPHALPDGQVGVLCRR